MPAGGTIMPETIWTSGNRDDVTCRICKRPIRTGHMYDRLSDPPVGYDDDFVRTELFHHWDCYMARTPEAQSPEEMKAGLNKFLQDMPLLQDEREMWMSAGFYMGPPQKTGNGNPVFVSPNGDKVAIEQGVAESLRRYIIAVWESRKPKISKQEAEEENDNSLAHRA